MFEANFFLCSHSFFGLFLFCHRSPTATSSWSHYMCHIFNGCNIIIFLFCRAYVYFSLFCVCCFSERSARLLATSSEYKPTCGWCAASFFIYFAMLLSWKHITISLCWHNNALSPPVAAIVHIVAVYMASLCLVYYAPIVGCMTNIYCVRFNFCFVAGFVQALTQPSLYPFALSFRPLCSNFDGEKTFSDVHAIAAVICPQYARSAFYLWLPAEWFSVLLYIVHFFCRLLYAYYYLYQHCLGLWQELHQ